jgi:hypothetical protein
LGLQFLNPKHIKCMFNGSAYHFFSNVVLQWLNFVIMSSLIDIQFLLLWVLYKTLQRHNKDAIVYNFLEVLFIIVCVSMCLFLHAKILKQLTWEMLEHYGFFFFHLVMCSIIKSFEFHVGHVTNWNQVNVEFFVVCISYK